MKVIDYEIDESGNPIEGTGKTTSITVDERKAAHSIMGFFSPEHKKIILIMSNSLNIFAYAPNDFLSELTLHELMHMVALQKQSKFLSIFKQDLISFYYKEDSSQVQKAFWFLHLYFSIVGGIFLICLLYSVLCYLTML